VKSDVTVFVWGPHQGLVPAAREQGALRTADSWLVNDGRVVGLELHRRRFFGACEGAAGGAPRGLRGFWEAAIAQLPRAGRWFPRVELAADPPHELRLRVRPAPSRSTSASLWINDEPDPRLAPRCKGPDLDALAELRRRAEAMGAHEALLTTPSGLVREAAHASLMWWDGERLCTPSPSLRVLPGVTLQILRGVARELGKTVEHRRCQVGALEGHEVWLVNALHGIRPVTRWVGAQMTAGPASRAASWQALLEARAESLPGDANAWSRRGGVK
jgi:branched-subunit amino acid aminotransferase/4-amino-4-deoxychorismate lyase